MKTILKILLITISIFFLTVGVYVNIDNPFWLAYDIVIGLVLLICYARLN